MTLKVFEKILTVFVKGSSPHLIASLTLNLNILCFARPLKIKLGEPLSDGD